MSETLNAAYRFIQVSKTNQKSAEDTHVQIDLLPFFIVHKLIIKQQTGYITFPGTVTGEGGTVGELEHREKQSLEFTNMEKHPSMIL